MHLKIKFGKEFRQRKKKSYKERKGTSLSRIENKHKVMRTHCKQVLIKEQPLNSTFRHGVSQPVTKLFTK